MVKQEPNRWVIVDAGREWEPVQEELSRVVEKRL